MWHSLKTIFTIPDWLTEVTPSTLRADMFAGITGATLVLPQGVAFAAIAGLPPEYGFYTAIITPIVAAFFGSSWHAVSGPTTAMSVLVFASLVGIAAPGSPEFISLAIVLALMVGLIQLALGFAKLGALVDFVSHSVLTGFVTGASVLIALSQLQHAFGIELPRPDDLRDFFVELFRNIQKTDSDALAISILALTVSVLVKRAIPRAPNYLFALGLGTGLYFLLGGENTSVKTVGVIPSVIPMFDIPKTSLVEFSALSSAALALALVGLLEAMSISRAIAAKSGQEIDNNREFVGQGMSNTIGSFFGCYPGSASFTRSGVNYESGAKTPASAIFAAIFLLLILLLVAPYFAYVPVPAMAGVIIHVAWRLVDFKELHHVATASRTETWIVVVTIGSALFINLEFAIYAGVLLSLVLFLNKTSRPFIGIGAPDPATKRRVFKFSQGLPECPQIVFAGLDGPLYFGSAEWVRRSLKRLERERQDQKHMVFIVKGVGEIDLPGAEVLIEEAERRRKRGGSFHLLTKSLRTLNKLARFEVMKHLTRSQIHLSKGDAISEIVPHLDPEICANCEIRLFVECNSRPGARNAELGA